MNKTPALGSVSAVRRDLFEKAFLPGHVHVEQFADTGATDIVFTIFRSAFPVRTKGGQLELGGCLFPSDRSLPQGEYAVEVAMGALASQPNVGRNALARVQLSSAAPTRWATLAGQTRASSQALDPGARTEQWVQTDRLQVHINSVAFAEPGFGERLEQLAFEHSTDLEGLRVMGERGELPLSTLETTDVLQTVQLEGRVSVAMQCGLGAGTFMVWGAYDEHDSLCRLLVDFDLFG